MTESQRARRERAERFKLANPDYNAKAQRRSKHGYDVDTWWPAMLARQAGLCYLCGNPLGVDSQNVTVIDHDHTHDYAHSSAQHTCKLCRRGLAHNRCNVAVGMSRDNPDMLETIARNLRAVLQPTRDRWNV